MAFTSISGRFLVIPAVLAIAIATNAQNPCVNGDYRALILSGGGLKGAFEAGAVYHLVVQRGCDFHDFAGISVGALNAAVLAQAPPSKDETESLANLAHRSEQLVGLWESFKGPRDILRHHRFGTVRTMAFGAEAINDFSPLRRVIEANVLLTDLAAGRPLRIGVTLFRDSRYHEIEFKGTSSTVPRARFLEYLYASAVLPVVARMPRIPDRDEEPDKARARQVADGSLRHVVPVMSYFMDCGQVSQACERSSAAMAAHTSLQQLFVIGTSPYRGPGDDSLPIPVDARHPNRTVVTRGPEIMAHTIAAMADTPYRADLEAMWRANDELQWRLRAYGHTAEPIPGGFPVESFNFDAADPLLSRPYTIALITPQKETVTIGDLSSFSRTTIRQQLLDGCLAADALMQAQFGLDSMANSCRERFAAERRQVAGLRAAR